MKKFLSISLAIVMIFTCIPLGAISVNAACALPLSDYPAGKWYGSGQCWSFANLVYNRYWGYSFTNSQYTNDNLIRDVPINAASRQATAANLKKYISQCPIGSCVRISRTLDYVTASSDGDAGHSFIVVNKDANGFTCYDIMGGYVCLNYRTYSYYAQYIYLTGGLPVGNAYIKYIKAGSVVHNHTYSNSCDTTCNTCGATRSISHTYSYSCDSSCNVCGTTRNVSHTYSYSCDSSCNVCGTTRSVRHTYSYSCDSSCNVCGTTRSVSHTYSNSCDTNCNVCGYSRSVSHNYSAGTCTKPKTCKVCGKTSGSALGHNYTDDCDKTCNRCNEVRTPNHKYTNTCDMDCNSCGESRTAPHSYEQSITSATTSKDGKVVKKCAVCGIIVGQSAIKRIKSVTLSGTSYTYNGKVKTPVVEVKDSAGKIVASKYYTVSYQSGRKNIGKYKVVVKFKGRYSGTKTLYFNILPPKTTVSKLTAGKKSATVYITKKSTQVTGYQIQYSTNKKFTNPKRKTVSGYKTTKIMLKGLKAKKTYYVRVRTYTKVGSKYYYSGWSGYKSVKTK